MNIVFRGTKFVITVLLLLLIIQFNIIDMHISLQLFAMVQPR